MTTKKPKETEAEQAERFQAEAQKLIDAGELSPIEAEKALDAIIRRASLRAR